jgi:hypothetical protein
MVTLSNPRGKAVSYAIERSGSNGMECGGIIIWEGLELNHENILIPFFIQGTIEPN